jgi:hypothetical protein
VSYNFLPMERSREALLPTNMWEWRPRDHFAYFVAEFADTLEFVVAAADVPREGAGARRGGAGRTEALSVVTSTGRRPRGQRPHEEALGGGLVASFAGEDVDDLAMLVNRPVRAGPAAGDLDVRLIDEPPLARPVPTRPGRLNQQGREALHPHR